VEKCDFTFDVCCNGNQPGQDTFDEECELTVLGHECPIIQTAEQRSECRFIKLSYNFQECRNDVRFSLVPVSLTSGHKEGTHIFETSRGFHVHAKAIEEYREDRTEMLLDVGTLSNPNASFEQVEKRDESINMFLSHHINIGKPCSSYT
jgi:hypothetical protein